MSGERAAVEVLQAQCNEKQKRANVAQPIERLKTIKILIIGAGVAGITAPDATDGFPLF